MKPIRTLIIAIALLMLTTGCSIATNAADTAAEEALKIAGIRSPAAARVILVEMNPDATSVGQIMKMVEPVVWHAAEEGAVIEVFIVSSGVAAAMTPVPLEAANNGVLRDNGKSEDAWKKEAAAYAPSVLNAIENAILEVEQDPTGTDLYGAVALAAKRVQQLEGTNRPEVILVTGGGIHRTSTFDMVNVDYATTDPADLIRTLEPIDAPSVSIQVLGAGNFANVSPAPDQVWVTGIASTWEEFCNSTNTHRCTLRDVYGKEG